MSTVIGRLRQGLKRMWLLVERSEVRYEKTPRFGAGNFIEAKAAPLCRTATGRSHTGRPTWTTCSS